MRINCLFLCLLISQCCYAEDPIRDYLVEQKPVWYDSPADNWRRAQAPEPEPQANSNQISVDKGSGGLGSFVITLMYVLIAALILYLIFQFVNQWSSKQQVELDKVPVKDRVKRIQVSDLPFQTDAQVDNPKFAMDQAAQDGQWARAIMYGLIVLLTELHKAQQIQLRPGKTNRNYLRELKGHKLRELLNNTVLLFERSFFGHEDISPNDAQLLCQQIRRSCDDLAKQGNIA